MTPDRTDPPDGLARAVDALRAGRADEAVGLLRPLAERLDDPAVQLLFGRALAAAGRTEDALARMRRVTQRRPPFPPAFLELGLGLADLGRLDEALAVLDSGVALMPGEAPLQVARGHVRLQAFDAPAAEACFSALLHAQPGRPDALAGLAKAKALGGDHEAAVGLLLQALAQRPEWSDLGLDLARSLLELGRRDEAEAILRRRKSTGPAIKTLAEASHGRLFLRPSVAGRFLQADDQAR